MPCGFEVFTYVARNRVGVRKPKRFKGSKAAKKDRR